MQFERMDYFTLDNVQEDMQKFDFICIPDGRAVGLAIKAPTPGPAVAKPAEVDAYSTINMHKVSPDAISDRDKDVQGKERTRRSKLII